MATTPQQTTQRSYFLQGLTLLFIAFKLAGIIGWAWAWVLAPLWGSALLKMIRFLLGKLDEVLSKRLSK